MLFPLQCTVCTQRNFPFVIEIVFEYVEVEYALKPLEIKFVDDCEESGFHYECMEQNRLKLLYECQQIYWCKVSINMKFKFSFFFANFGVWWYHAAKTPNWIDKLTWISTLTLNRKKYIWFTFQKFKIHTYIQYSSRIERNTC